MSLTEAGNASSGYFPESGLVESLPPSVVDSADDVVVNDEDLANTHEIAAVTAPETGFFPEFGIVECGEPVVAGRSERKKIQLAPWALDLNGTADQVVMESYIPDSQTARMAACRNLYRHTKWILEMVAASPATAAPYLLQLYEERINTPQEAEALGLYVDCQNLAEDESRRITTFNQE